MDNTGLMSRSELACLFAQHEIEIRYDFLAPADDVLPYHGVRHSLRVSRDAAMLAERMGCLPYDVELAQMAGSFHDIRRTWVEVKDADGCVVRKARSPLDEAESVVMFVGHAHCGHWLREDEIALVAAAIMATVPAFGAPGEIRQPLLLPQSHPVVRAVALADLNGAALANTPEKVAASAREVDLLFREYELGLSQMLRKTASRSEFPAELAGIYRGRMLAALDYQEGFLDHRYRRLSDELGPYRADADVLEVINHEHIEQVFTEVRALRDRRLDMGFWEIAADMGYELPAV